MKKYRLHIIGCCFSLALFACSGSSNLPDNAFLVTGNTPPADATIAHTVVNNYINKVFIGALARDPSPSEVETATETLRAHNLSPQDRREFLDTVFAQPEYNAFIYKQGVNDLLNFIFDPDPDHIQTTIDIWEQLEKNDHNVAELKRLRKLQTILPDLASGELEEIGLQRRLAYNSYYDFVNMGTENFVVSMFQNFFLRYPSLSEMENGKRMVDGEEAILLGQKGSSKADFVEIFFNSTDYFEGQVRTLYLRYLFREPSSEEMVYHTLKFERERNMKELKKEILSLDEFVGIQ